MPVTYWDQTTIDGKEYLVIDTATFRVPLDWDPSSNMFIAVASPTGGVGNFPALVKGDTGDPPTISTTINLTALEYTDATLDSATWTETSPDTYELSLVLHKGPPGIDGTSTLLGVTDLTGTPLPKKIIVVNDTSDGFVYATERVGDRYVPATIANTPSGNAVYTLASVTVTAQDFDWRPEVSGQCVVTGTGTDVQVDLIARLDNPTSGNIVGRAFGYAGQYPPTHVLSSGPPAGAADSYDKVTAGVAAVVYLRAEKQSGADSFTTSAATTTFCVRVRPVP